MSSWLSYGARAVQLDFKADKDHFITVDIFVNSNVLEVLQINKKMTNSPIKDWPEV